MDNALFMRLITRAIPRVSAGSIAHSDPYFIDEEAVWIVENIPEETVVDP